MANFSVNQVRHLYAATAIGTADTKTKRMKENKVGTIMLNGTPDTLYFEYQGNGGRMRSDLIKVDSVVWARHTPAAKQARALKKVTVTLDENYLIVNDGKKYVVPGQDYILRIVFRQFAGMSDEDTYIKYGLVHGVKGMDEGQFYAKMKESLDKNFSRELTELLTFTASPTGLVIEEVEQDWILGIKSQVPVYFEVIPTTITFDGDEVVWAKDKTTGKLVKEENSDKTVPNSKQLADLEYFCMGERGDIYRQVGWPNYVPTKYILDGEDKEGYDVLDIHYYFEGAGENPQKSEKDITIVGKNAVINSLVSALREKKINVTVVQ